MPKQSLTTREFLALHPFCCFCGGVVPATTRDHVPPKIAFLNKVWPEGFEFPACEPCNAASRLFDQEFAMLSTFGGLENPAAQQRQQFSKLFEGVTNNNLGLAMGLRMAPEAKRDALDQIGYNPPAGAEYKDFPIIQLPPRAGLAIEVLSFKLGCALHYKHLKEALPETGKVMSNLRTNYAVLTEGNLRGIEHSTTLAKIPKRNGQDFSDQFAYRFGVEIPRRMGAFICKFRQSFQLEIGTYATPPVYSTAINAIPFVRDFLKSLGPL